MTPSQHVDSYYAATAQGVLDRPRLEGELSCDVCVVGGGFTGLSAALHLAERGYQVALLEAERLGWGASGRNGGQLNSGQRKGQGELERRLGKAAARQLWDLAEEAKATVRERIARHGISCDLKPGVLIAAYKPGDVAWLEGEAERLARDYGYGEIRAVSRGEMAEMLGSGIYHGGTLDSGAGHLHPLNYAVGLARAAAAALLRARPQQVGHAVDRRLDLGSRRRQAGFRFGDMDDGPGFGAFARVDDGDLSAEPAQVAGVAGLQPDLLATIKETFAPKK